MADLIQRIQKINTEEILIRKSLSCRHHGNDAQALRSLFVERAKAVVINNKTEESKDQLAIKSHDRRRCLVGQVRRMMDKDNTYDLFRIDDPLNTNYRSQAQYK